MDFEHIFQATSLCPYTEQCDSYRTMVNSERWMGKALTRLRREGLSALPREEGGYTERGLEERLERLRSVKDRCHRHNGRCLRYWQLWGICRPKTSSSSLSLLAPSSRFTKLKSFLTWASGIQIHYDAALLGPLTSLASSL